MPSSLATLHLDSSKAISQYIKSIYSNNHKTGINYAKRLKNFEGFFSKKYNFTLDDYLIHKTFNVDVYELLADYTFYLTDDYVSPDGFKLSNITIKNTVNTAINFLMYHDQDINPRKLKHKVRLPRVIRQNKEALTKEDITKILQTCVTLKLRTFVHLLAVTGCRASEACAVRLQDIDWKNSRLNIRGEYTKTKVDRYVFLTEEVITQLQEYIKHKYRKRVKYYETGKPPVVVIPKQKETDLLFESYFYKTKPKKKTNTNPEDEERERVSYVYNNLLLKFEKTLDLMGIYYENNSTKRRRRLTFHSFRRWAKSTISDLGLSDYSEWYIGHIGSTYYRRSDKEKYEIFKKLEPYFTFQDYKGMTARNAEIQNRFEILEQENLKLKQSQEEMAQQFTQVMEMIQDNPKLVKVKPEVLIKKTKDN
jgi:integrase